MATFTFTNKNGEPREITGTEQPAPKTWKAATRKANIIVKYTKDGETRHRTIPRDRITKVGA